MPHSNPDDPWDASVLSWAVKMLVLTAQYQSVIASRYNPGNGIHVIRKQEGLGLQVKNGPRLECFFHCLGW